MRTVLPHFDRFGTIISLKLKRLRALISKNKKISYGSAVAVAFLALPLGAYALGGTSGNNSPRMITKDTQQPENKSNTTVSSGGSDNNSRGNPSTESSGVGSGVGGNDNNVNVTVNGQAIPAPENGTVHKQLKDEKNNSVVDVMIDNNSSHANQDGTSSSFTSVEINQHSYSSSTDEESNMGRSDYRRQPRTPF